MPFVCLNWHLGTNNFVTIIVTFFERGNLGETQQTKSESQLAKTERNDNRKKGNRGGGDVGGASLWGRLRLKGDEGEWMKKGAAAAAAAELSIHLEEEIKVAAAAIPNPVGLHGFDPVPLWEVGQGIEQGLREVGGEAVKIE